MTEDLVVVEPTDLIPPSFSKEDELYDWMNKSCGGKLEKAVSAASDWWVTTLTALHCADQFYGYEAGGANKEPERLVAWCSRNGLDTASKRVKARQAIRGWLTSGFSLQHLLADLTVGHLENVGACHYSERSQLIEHILADPNISAAETQRLSRDFNKSEKVIRTRLADAEEVLAQRLKVRDEYSTGNRNIRTNPEYKAINGTIDNARRQVRLIKAQLDTIINERLLTTESEQKTTQQLNECIRSLEKKLSVRKLKETSLLKKELKKLHAELAIKQSDNVSRDFNVESYSSKERFKNARNYIVSGHQQWVAAIVSYFTEGHDYDDVAAVMQNLIFIRDLLNKYLPAEVHPPISITSTQEQTK